GASSSAPAISLTERGPGTGSNGRRSQLRPPTTGSAPSYTRAGSDVASAPTTSPPPPMPITSGRRHPRNSSSASRILLVVAGGRVWSPTQREVLIPRVEPPEEEGSP